MTIKMVDCSVCAKNKLVAKRFLQNNIYDTKTYFSLFIQFLNRKNSEVDIGDGYCLPSSLQTQIPSNKCFYHNFLSIEIEDVVTR